jgi:YD repeat-containing protein
MVYIRRHIKVISAFLVLIILQSVILPPVSKALTGGPSSPEVNSFKPIDASNMVNKFTGDFSYNIPLMKIGDYPVNISYDSDIRMDEEASWTGLGWNLNPGVMKRTMRGLPDDHKGDKVIKEKNFKENKTRGMSVGVSNIEVFGEGVLDLGVGFGLFHNTNKGWGTDYSLNPTLNVENFAGGSLSTGLNLNYNSQSGLGVSPNLSYSTMVQDDWDKNTRMGINIGMPFHSRTGMKSLSLGVTKSSSALKWSSKDSELKSKSGSASTTASLDFAGASFTPSSQFPWVSINHSYRATVGGDFWGGHPMIYGNGYITTQKLAKNTDRLSSYGYMYAHAGDNNLKALHDFNRKNRGASGPKYPHLPVTSFNYDIFSASGQGVQGTYRPFRNDIGTVFSKKITSKDNSYNGGGEYGGGSLVHLGGDFTMINSTTTSGKWEKSNGNNSLDRLSFKDKSELPGDIKPYYFGRAGEKNAINKNFYDKIKEDDAIRVKLNMSGWNISSEKKYYNESREKYENIPANNSRSERKKTTQPLRVLTAKNAAEAALEEKLNSYKKNESYNNNGELPKKLSIDRINNDFAKSHHISSITVIKPNGKRYVYGLPAYNRYEKDVSFSVNTGSSDNPLDCEEGLVGFTGSDASKGNDNGRQHFYSSTEKPPYAHSFRLTAVLSPDYVDKTGNGISEDDLGNYTKLNYTRVHKNYKWRVPFEDAKFNEGMKSVDHDDKANYTYGKKDLWYLHSIESRNQIAEFYISERSDAHEVKGEMGGPGNDAMMKLDSIALYNKHDRKKHQDLATPIKMAHFEYNYELCQGVPNNTDNSTKGGKLTLKKMYFTYGHSQKGELHPYEFEYDNFNPDYNSNGYNRWGRYKPSTVTCNEDKLRPGDFPYVSQDKSVTDNRAAAWTMKRIHLPSGGIIDVEYESDDYAFVQNRLAMEMFKLEGTGTDPSDYQSSKDNKLYTKKSFPRDHIFVKLREPVANETALKNRYFGGKDQLENLYIKALTNLKDDHYEFVPTYATAEDYGLVSGKNDVAWIELKDRNVERKANQRTHPISKQGWHMLRKQLPQVYNNKQGVSGLDAFFSAFVDFASEFSKLFTAFEGYCQNKGFAKEIDKDKSWVRLFSPDRQKLGGGSRVKKLLIKDQWGNMVGDQGRNYSYGKVYDYTKVGPEGNQISSGVAAYEPMLGNEVNPFRQPLEEFSLRDNPAGPGELHLVEAPLLETFFPSPQVGYSKVTVKNLSRKGVERTATGRSVHKFYTAKDFPTITKNTGKEPKVKKPSDAGKLLRSLLSLKVKNKYAASEGFVIELNDMHGKPKAKIQYAQKNNASAKSNKELFWDEQDQPYITKKRYHYNVTERQARYPQEGYRAFDHLKLDNEVNVVDENGQLSTATMGVDYQMINDTRFEKSKTSSVGVEVNVETMLLGFIPIPVPIPCPHPSWSSKKSVYQSISTTKVIKRHGIKTKTEVHEKGSKIDKKNLAFDKETGKPLLTSTENAFEDRKYNFTYPAHWRYEGMNLAYQNLGMEFNNVSFQNGEISGVNAPGSIFTDGDMLMAFKNGKGQRIWAHESDEDGLVFLDESGHYVDKGTSRVKIIRSGHRNRPSEAIGKVQTMKNPLNGNGNSLQLDKKVLQANAIQFSDDWQTYGEYVQDAYCTASEEDQNGMKALENLLNNLADNNDLTSKQEVDLATSPYRENYNMLDNIIRNISGVCEDTVYYWKGSGDENDTSKVIPDPYISNVVTPPSTPETDTNKLTSRIGCCYGFSLKTTDGSSVDFAKVSNFHDLRPENLMECDFPGQLKVSVNDQYGNKIDLEIDFSSGECWPEIEGCTPHCHWNEQIQVNPYLSGIKGRWHKQREFKYVTDRLLTDNSGQTNIRKDGIYTNFKPFWQMTNGEWENNANEERWVWQNEVTLFGPYGHELENKDALGRYSSAVFGYNNQKPVAVAENAAYSQIAFEGFESYDYRNQTNRCHSTENWNSTKAINGINRTQNEQHSGDYSLKVPADSEFLHHQKVVPKYWCNTHDPPTLSGFYAKKEDFIPRLDIRKDKKYLIQGWVKVNNAKDYSNRDGYDQPSLELQAIEVGQSFSDFDTAYFSFKPEGKVIEGWQRVEGSFEVHHDMDILQLFLKAGSDEAVYFDDIRVQPFDAQLRSFVYHPDNLRLTAELDENNFATFYEYDQQGNLTRIKKETTNGIRTIKEAREAKSKRKY